jgi:hypothetical protein
MKEILKIIKADLPKVEALPDRVAAFRAEETRLVAEIKQLSRLVAAGDEKSIPRLGIVREQLVQLPAKYEQLQAEDAEILTELADAVGRMYPALCQAFSDEQCRVAEVTEKFLERLGCSAYFVQQISRQVAKEAATVVKLDRARAVFYGLNIAQRINKEATISRANFALEQFGDCITPTHSPAKEAKLK